MDTSFERRLVRVEHTPAPQPGFIGPGHTAVDVVRPDALTTTDPFVLLMDDRLAIEPRRTIGGPHPHAGIETVTLVLDGTFVDRDEGVLAPGDAVWMTAGRGVIHNESVEAGLGRILQLWIRLPARDRELAPSFETIRRATAPLREEPGVRARLYSGATGELRSPTKNRVPITLVDVELEANARFEQALPRSYNGFLYVVSGELEAGGRRLGEGDVGWLDRAEGAGEDRLILATGAAPARVVLYAGEPQHEPLVHYGPFVGGTMGEIEQRYLSFRAGRFVRMSALSDGAGR